MSANTVPKVTMQMLLKMTPEVRAKFSRVTGLVVDLLKQHSEGPIEAYMMLQFIQHSFEDAYGIRGSVIVGNSDEEKKA